MSPKPQDVSPTEEPSVEECGERIVISGMAGLYPESHSVKEFGNILYNRINPVTSKDCRWNYDHPEVSPYTGKVPDLELFDAQFFKVHYRLGHSMDSMSRKLLEQAFQAIYDAGVNSDQLSGKKIGCYIGSCFSETEKTTFYIATTKTGFGIMGCSKSMFANRVSYWLNAKGPSIAVDQSCCSSVVALELAYQAMMRGDVDAAVIGGASLCLFPQSSVHFRRVMLINRDGKTKSFDKNACGCAKSEAINVFFLQKAKDARRIYAEVVYVKSEFTGLVEGENVPKYGFYREPEKLANFLHQFYKEAKVDPKEVQYVEAVGSATPEADKAELETIDKVFCKDRNEPLFVGSVMSNIGYGEAASGLSAITKVLLSYEKGQLPSNLHCATLRDDVDGLKKGLMRFVTDHQTFQRGFTAVNNLSVTGVNAHILLHGHYKPKDLNKYKSSIPHLVTLSGRQQSSVEKIINDLKSRPVDPEEIALLHSIHEDKISGHMGRGFVVLDTNENNETIIISEKADYYSDVTNPLWFVYSGMGSQWAGMGAQLMRIPVFAAAIERCDKALKPKGLDLIHIITSPDKNIFDNILHSFVGIAAIQIGLTDVLTALEIVPDKVIGHSVGELGCAYADGCFTAEEMILSAYSRGLVSVQTPFIKGSMAAVGLGYLQVRELCPPEIEIACHNSSESATISGPAGVMKDFVASLTAKGIFAKEVPSSNIAYHSKYISEAGPGLLKYLKEVITTPKPRSERWVSTSVPQDQWDESLAKYSSAEYHTNNLLNSVLFEEASRMIPKNAVVVEIAPHGLLQAILKRSLARCANIALTSRGHKDNAAFLLEAIGKLYMEGFHPKVQVLYPKVQFPVSTGTPMLGHLIEWAHTEKWSLPSYIAAMKKTAAACKFVISVHDEEHSYLRGHVVKEKNLYPFSAALVAVWDTFAMSLDLKKRNVSVEFKDIRVFVQPILYKTRQLKLDVNLHRGTGIFEMDEQLQITPKELKKAEEFGEQLLKERDDSEKEVTNDNMVVAKGQIVMSEKNDDYYRLFKLSAENKEAMTLTCEDIYKLFYTRDYKYSGDFRTLREANLSLTEAKVSWQNNWVTFIDGLLQLNLLRNLEDMTASPEYIRKITIDVESHSTVSVGKNELIANVFDVFDCTRCGGVLIENLRFRELSVMKNDRLSLKTMQFLPHFPNDQTTETTALYTYLQIIVENIDKEEITILEIVDDEPNNSKSFVDIHKIIDDIPKIKAKYSIVHEDNLQRVDNISDVDVIFTNDLSSNEKLCTTISKHLLPNTFIINKGPSKILKLHSPSLFAVVGSCDIGTYFIQLIKWLPKMSTAGTSVFTLENELDVRSLQSTIGALPRAQQIILVASYPPIPNLDDLAAGLRKNGYPVNLMIINDELNGDEDFPKCNLAKMVLEGGQWGGFYYLPIEELPKVSNHVTLENTQIGDLNSLKWVEAPDLAGPGINVTVHYAGINDVDVKRAAGEISFRKDIKRYFGMDFSGTTDNGTRVMGLLKGGALSDRVKANSNLLWPVPEFWTLEEAATVPLAYSLAFYCLAIKQKLLPGMKILVHGGTGALGQAAISICLAHDCEVFTTVSDQSKKHFLRKLFPGLKDDHIGNSRDMTFGDMVLGSTGGYGCDIIVNCPKGVLKNMTLKCCAPSGTVIDPGLLQNNEHFNYGMYFMTKCRSYTAVDLSSILTYQNEREMKFLQVLMSEGIAHGYVRPLTRVTFPPAEVSRAFRLVAASRQRGRVLIDMQPDIPTAKSRLYNSSHYYHIIISDDDVLAMQLIDRLIDGGVRKFRLVSSKKSNCIIYKIRKWKKIGAEIELILSDAWDQTDTSVALDSDIKDKVEGIYTIISNNSGDANVIKYLEDLDCKTRDGYSKLRYFAVIDVNRIDQMTGEHVCLLRRKCQQPATFIKLPDLQQNDNGELSTSISSAIDAIELALLSKKVSTVAHIVRTTNKSLIREISALADIKIPDTADEKTSLLELQIEPAISKILQTYLRDQYHLWFDENEITNLTIQKLREIQEMVSETDFKDPKGLATFFSYIDSDELLATTEMTFLPTLASSSALRHCEFDASQIFVCIIPGVEGNHARFSAMCERLKLPAMVLQPALGRPESLHEMAQRFAETLIRLTKLENFYLLGYESGVIVALEMAAVLERHGLTGLVFCLGGTPKSIQAEFKTTLDRYKDEESLQEGICRHMMTLMYKEKDFKDMFKTSSSWQEKVATCVRNLTGRVNLSNQYVYELIDTAYSRIVQVRNYAFKPLKLKSKLIVLRPKMLPSNDMLGKDSLQNYSVQPIVEYDLQAPLAFAAQDMRCAGIVNKHLDEDILAAFEQQNLCETYLLSEDAIMVKG